MSKRPRKAETCPQCGKAVVDKSHAPFCSAVCRDRDLLQWLNEGYRLPGRPAEDEGEDHEG
ncbi:MAG: DNA gyrase inhibitor YacG [Sphingomonadaceae bacterium]